MRMCKAIVVSLEVTEHLHGKTHLANATLGCLASSSELWFIDVRFDKFAAHLDASHLVWRRTIHRTLILTSRWVVQSADAAVFAYVDKIEFSLAHNSGSVGGKSLSSSLRMFLVTVFAGSRVRRIAGL